MTDTLLVSELFYSIQGESTRAGLPCLFVRLSGCNLRCSYCDASYTWEEAGQAMSVAELLSWIKGVPAVMVEITGGEPLTQPAVYPLMSALLDTGRPLLLETNGSLPLDRVADEVGIIMDIKCPGSGMDAHNLEENLEILRARQQRGCRDEIKCVLSSEDDFHWARELVCREGLEDWAVLFFSPVVSRLTPASLAALLLAHRLTVRLQIQLHTILWPELRRGV